MGLVWGLKAIKAGGPSLLRQTSHVAHGKKDTIGEVSNMPVETWLRVEAALLLDINVR